MENDYLRHVDEVRASAAGGRSLAQIRDGIAASLRSTGDNPFAAAADGTFDHLVTPLTSWLRTQAAALNPEGRLAYLYVEMNGFDINCDRWFCDAFGYDQIVDLNELDQLAGFAYESDPSDSLTLTGMKRMQRAFAAPAGAAHPGVASARALAQALVEVRFLAVVSQAVGASGVGTPVAAAAHDSDLVIQF